LQKKVREHFVERLYSNLHTNDVVIIVASYMDPSAGVEQSLMLTLEHIPWIIQALS
jgi:hypothetical protein